jgi:hypothetical protein
MYVSLTVKLTLVDLGYPVYALWFYCSQNFLNYLVFQPFDFERTWWRLYQARLVRTKLDIYFFIETMYAETIKYWGTNTIRGLTGIKRFKFLYIHHSHISVAS